MYVDKEKSKCKTIRIETINSEMDGFDLLIPAWKIEGILDTKSIVVVVELRTRPYPRALAENDIKNPRRGEIVSNTHPAIREPIV